LAIVSPRFVPLSNPLAHISDVYNGILVEANMLDKVLFYGKGAGKLPTASAVVADIMDIVEKMPNKNAPVIEWTDATNDDVADINDYLCKRCIITNGQAIITEKITLGAAKNLALSHSNDYKIYSIL
jgi:hypothetical protein